MDYRIRKLKAGDSSSSLLSRSLPTSRSFPTTVKHNCFQQCLNSSTDSLNSTASRSPKLGQYRKLPNVTECDVCHKLVRDITTLKCSHSACGKCMERQKIEKNGCPPCILDSSDSQSSSSNDPSTDDFQNILADDAMFDNFELERGGESSKSTEYLLNYIETKVLNDLRENLSSLREAQLDICKESAEQIDKLRDHVEQLKILIDKKAEQLIQSVQESKTRHLADLERQEKDLQNFHDSVAETVVTMRTIENKHTCDYDNEQLTRLIKLTDQIGEENVHIRYNVKPLTDSTINNIVGKVGVRVFLRNKLTTNTIRTLICPGAIQAICPISAQQAWIAYQKFVQLCAKSGARCPPIDVGDDVQDLCLDYVSNVLIACESSVKQLTSDSTSISTLFTCSEPVQGITCHEDGNIITCLRNNIIVFTKDGVQLSEFSCDGAYDIKMPHKVARNVNNDILVSDFHSRFGDVAIFDSDGRAIAKIRTDGMTPRGVACNRQGLIYVCDFRADRINVYSTHGHFLQTLVSSSCGLSGPLSVAVGPSGDLWVGDWRRRVRVFTQNTDQSKHADFYT